MTDVPDEVEKLLVDVRKMIAENKQFLEKLIDESSVEEDHTDDVSDSSVVLEEDFEEL